MTNYKKELWEMATGKNTIRAVNDKIGSQIDLNQEFVMKIIIDFYFYLERDFALGLIDYGK